MDAARMLDCLEPFSPARVARWRQALPAVRPGTRALLEREIHRAFARAFPHARSGPVLPPPPPGRVDGLCRLGTAPYGSLKCPFGLDRAALLQNTSIFGRAGAGKTNVAYLILEYLLAQKVPFVFFDWKRTCRDLLLDYPGRFRVYTPGRTVRPFAFNPFEPPAGLEPLAYIHQAVDVLAAAYTLGDGAKSLLLSALRELLARGESGPVSPESVLRALEARRPTGRAAGWHATAARALESLSHHAGTPAGDSAGGKPGGALRRLPTESTVLELDAVPLSFKKALIPLVCLHVFYHHLRGARERLRYVVFIEEAHHLLHTRPGAHETVLEGLLRQGRELGIGTVVLDQHPHLVSPAAHANAHTSIYLNLKDPRDIRHATSAAGIPADQASGLSRLPVGSGVVKMQAGWTRPFLAQFRKHPITKGRVSDADLTGSPHDRAALSRSPPPQTLKKGALAGSHHPDKPVPTAALALLQDVLSHPFDGVDKRYKRLGWSAGTGHKHKSCLLNAHLLRERRVHTGRTVRALLEVTDRAREWLPPGKPGRRESVEHAYWKHYYARMLESRGWEVTVERPRPPGYADVYARKGTREIIIEIETGRSDAMRNLRSDLQVFSCLIVVVATSRSVERTLIQDLALSRLRIPTRSLVHLAGSPLPRSLALTSSPRFSLSLG